MGRDSAHAQEENSLRHVVLYSPWGVVIILGGLLLVVCVPWCLAMAATFLYEVCTQTGPPTTPHVDDLSEHTGIQLPSDAQLLGYADEELADGWLAKVAIRRDAVETLLPASAKTTTESKFGIAEGICFLVDPPWWDPNSTQEFVAAHLPGPGRRVSDVNVLIALDDPERALVYVRAWRDEGTWWW